MTENGSPRLVKALYNFKGANNDELCFSKGDFVTVTQIIEGGWWEGTLNDKTGWFPSNYVKEVKSDPANRAKSPTGKTPPSIDLKMNKRESMLVYHRVVLQNLIDTERTYVNDLHGLLSSFLRPLSSSAVLSSTEYLRLCGNLEEICKVHQNLLATLDECSANAVSQQRIGGIFLKTAAQIQSLYQSYSGNHPTAVAVLQQKKDELNKFMEEHGAPTPGIMTLTTSLSKPFARLEKYSNLLKEVERHIEESHVDRGDTQRAISVYREIAGAALERRKQKEIEYEILNSTIKGWEGDDIHMLGEVIMLSQVRVVSDNGDKAEQLFLLFHGVLVMLSVSSHLSGYSYEGKLSVSGLTIRSLDENEAPTSSFEISGTLIDKRVVTCATKDEQSKWVDMLTHQARHGPTLPSKVQPIQVHTSHGVVSQVLAAKSNHASQRPYRPASARPWTFSCLRPSPPFRPTAGSLRDEVTRSPRSGRKILGGGSRRAKPVDDTKILEEDAVILKVIEAYCSSAKARQTVNSLDLTKIRLTPHALKNGNRLPSTVSEETDSNDVLDESDYISLHMSDLDDLDEGSLTLTQLRQSRSFQRQALLDTPSLLIAEEEKIIVEEVKGNQTVVEEKSLVDTVYSLKDQIKEMKQEQQRLRKDLEDEKRARKRLETLLRKSVVMMEPAPTPLDGIHESPA